jgi:hypothetical protein
LPPDQQKAPPVVVVTAAATAPPLSFSPVRRPPLARRWRETRLNYHFLFCYKRTSRSLEECAATYYGLQWPTSACARRQRRRLVIFTTRKSHASAEKSLICFDCVRSLARLCAPPPFRVHHLLRSLRPCTRSLAAATHLHLFRHALMGPPGRRRRHSSSCESRRRQPAASSRADT